MREMRAKQTHEEKPTEGIRNVHRMREKRSKQTDEEKRTEGRRNVHRIREKGPNKQMKKNALKV